VLVATFRVPRLAGMRYPGGPVCTIPPTGELGIEKVGLGYAEAIPAAAALERPIEGA